MVTTKQIADKYLHRGDMAEIAQKLGVAKQTVWKVKSGLLHKPEVEVAILTKSQERKEQMEKINAINQELKEDMQELSQACQS